MEELYNNKTKLLWYLIKNWNINDANEVLDELLYTFFIKYYNKYDGRVELTTYFIGYMNMQMLYIMRNKKYDLKLRRIVELEGDFNDDIIKEEDKEYTIEKLNKILPILDEDANKNSKMLYNKWYKYIISNINGKTIKEIAEEEGENENTIKSRMYQTRKRIKEVYKTIYKNQ